MKRLQLVGLLDSIDEHSNEWQFSEHLVKKESDFFRTLVPKYNTIAIEYSILCTQLISQHKYVNRNAEDIKQMIITALMMAELLVYLYDCYLIIPKEAARLKEDQAVYRQLLCQHNINFNLDISNEPIKETWIDKFVDPTSDTIINHTGTINPFRTFIIRVKRLLTALVPLIKSSQKYSWWIHCIDKYTNPTIGYLSFLFFLPRLCLNSFMLIKHAIEGSWMNRHNREINFLTCLNLQFQRRWFEIGNDVVWIIAGITTFFLGSGPLASVMMAVTVAAYVYDVIATIIRFNQEMSHLENIRENYRLILKQMRTDNASPNELLNLAQYQACITQRIDFERRRLLVSVCSTTALTLAIIICLPCFAINPVIPVIGACFLVAITAITYLVVQMIDRQRPPTRVQSILTLDAVPKLSVGKLRFFHKQTTEEVKTKEEKVNTNACLSLQR